MYKLCLIAFCLLTIYLNESNAVLNPKVVCYYESWGYWRQGRGKMTVNDIDSSLCTHLVYAYFGISSSYKIHVLDPYLMEEMHDLSNFVKKKGSAKAMIAIGGSAQSANFKTMASTDADRTVFVESVIEFLKKYNFDGVMIDWQYPEHNEFDSYVKLLDKFDEKFSGTSFTLGITGSPNKALIDSMDIKKIIDFVDFVHVLTFDLHGLWESTVDYCAPLDWQISTLNHWWAKGAPKHKLLMSIPMFARTWTLTKVENNERTAGASGPGAAGPYTQAAGLLSYNELCSMMKSSPSQWILRTDLVNTAVYAIHGREWVSYESPKTAELKAKNATTEGFGGIVAYALTNEDFHGDCSGTKFPLLHAINSGLNHDAIKEGTPPTTNTQDPHVTLITSKPVTQPEGLFVCQKEGFFRDPLNCQKYHVCLKTEIPGLWEDKIERCQSTNDGYDETAHKCIHKQLIPGCH